MAASDLLLTVTVKNNRLLSAIRDGGHESAAAFARAAGVPAPNVYEYLSLRRAPLRQNGEWRPDIVKIATTLRTLPEDLFPEAFLSKTLKTNRVTREIRSEDLAALAGPSQSIAYDPEAGLERSDALAALDDALASIPPRYAAVLRAYYGFDGQPQTLAQVGKAFGITQERARQIVLSAERRLRNPAADLRRLCAPILEPAA